LVATVGVATITGSLPAGAATPLTPTQVVGALAAMAPSYPGGIAGLGGLFDDSGPCAGVTDSSSLAANADCESVLSQIESAAQSVTTPTPLTYDGSTDSNSFAAVPPVAPPVPPVPANPGLLVAFGDSVTSGHNVQPNASGFNVLLNKPNPGVTTCDDPVYSYANALSTMLGIPAGGYTNVAHSGATTTEALSATGFKNSCNQVVQPVASGSEVAQASAVLAANPSNGNVVNVSVGPAAPTTRTGSRC
jgi:hypothetical protein